MLRKVWRRFKPRRRGHLSDKTAYEDSSIYARAREIVDQTLSEARISTHASRSSYKTLARAVKKLQQRQSHDVSHMLAKIILMSPGAARAQHEMDKHQGGYKNRQARVYELIDFNDAFVDTVLALDQQYLSDFTERLKEEMTLFCQRMNAQPLDDDQYYAIVHGLSREIAVYFGAKDLGYVPHMTSRVQDAMGIDMIISDPETKKTLHIDVKTNSSFHFRLLNLKRAKRIDEEKHMHCELAGFCTIRNGKGVKAVDTVLFRVSTKYLGPIKDFRFDDTEKFSALLRAALDNYGRYV